MSTQVSIPDDIVAILCEDARAEVSGKFTLVGVLAGDVETEESRFDARLTVFLIVKGLRPGKRALRMRVRNPEGKIVENSFEISAEGSPGVVPIAGVPFTTESSGIFDVGIKIDRGRWKGVASLSVAVNSSDAEVQDLTKSDLSS